MSRINFLIFFLIFFNNSFAQFSSEQIAEINSNIEINYFDSLSQAVCKVSVDFVLTQNNDINQINLVINDKVGGVMYNQTLNIANLFINDDLENQLKVYQFQLNDFVFLEDYTISVQFKNQNNELSEFIIL